MAGRNKQTNKQTVANFKMRIRVFRDVIPYRLTGLWTYRLFGVPCCIHKWRTFLNNLKIQTTRSLQNAVAYLCTLCRHSRHHIAQEWNLDHNRLRIYKKTEERQPFEKYDACNIQANYWNWDFGKTEMEINTQLPYTNGLLYPSIREGH